jgi:hypothetical protein
VKTKELLALAPVIKPVTRPLLFGNHLIQLTIITLYMRPLPTLWRKPNVNKTAINEYFSDKEVAAIEPLRESNCFLRKKLFNLL